MAEVRSEMVGNVWKIVAKVGDEVEDGDTIVILESMKMEIPIETEFDGVVSKILVAEGDQVEDGTLIALVTEED